MSETIRCHACGTEMVRDVRPDEVVYKGHAEKIDQPGWFCQGCDEVVLEGGDSAVADEAFIRLRAEVDGVLTPQEVTRIRQRLGLSQRQAGALLGGGPRSFQKYESGTDWVTKAMANLLRLLDRDPTRIEELIALTRSGTDPRVRSGRRRAGSPSRAQPERVR
ncbi:MAG: type II toxin-antitoxin system MqsA family antitoxin [Myxococcota bacterium]|jgi:HTH-type transcriptional regulator/antitoxin MqsA|nr:type II toxin-antitoxin system MqsA family antitoxin [Myxococcota bacterium]